MRIEDLLVEAEDVTTGERIIGFVCGCAECRKPYENFNGDISRPQGMLTSYDGTYGNIKVFTDTMRLINKD